MYISGNPISDIGGIAISKANWPNFTTLYISRSLTDTAAIEISKANWPNLTALSIEGDFTNIGKAISKGKWPLLTYLGLHNFSNCESSYNGLLEGNWPNLNYLLLIGSISASVIEEVSNARLEKLNSLSLLETSKDNRVDNNKYGEALPKGILMN